LPFSTPATLCAITLCAIISATRIAYTPHPLLQLLRIQRVHLRHDGID
jgi:hypothetical protein